MRLGTGGLTGDDEDVQSRRALLPQREKS
jgi:hypothetical protein